MATPGSPIGPQDLSPRFAEVPSQENWTGDGTLKDRVSHFEGVVIKRTLAECDDNATRAAAALGISRATLYKKLERYSIDRGGRMSQIP
jgi:transcriptional regulator with PAS, ATPase and Fis domain